MGAPAALIPCQLPVLDPQEEPLEADQEGTSFDLLIDTLKL